MTCPETIAVGAYVLGALDPRERVETELHLQECASCRAALLQFAELPGLLHGVALEDITTPAGDDTTPALELPQTDARRSRSQAVRRPWVQPAVMRRVRLPWRLLAAAGVVIVAVLAGGLGGRAVLGDGDPAPQSQTPPQTQTPPRAGAVWVATDGVYGIDTTAELTGYAWGTGIKLSMSDLQPGQRCKLVVHARNGVSETTGWWSTTGARQAVVPASTSIPLADIDRVEILTAADTVLTTLTNKTR